LENYMKQSNALEKYWHHAIKPEHLQAEINRMIKETKNSAVLQELFATLDNDPYVIAECLARPLLVERLIRNWYAFDPTFHSALRSKAQAELDTLGLEG